jgi:hypothetical protein
MRDRALGAAGDIAAALLSAGMPEGETTTDPTLNGSLGAVLLFTAMGETAGNGYLDAARHLFDDAIERTGELAQPSFHLYTAPVGVGWVDEQVRGRLADDDEDDEDSDVDVFLARVLDTDTWPWPIDLLHGLAGIGTYSLARQSHPRARRNLERVVGHLANLAEEVGAGVTWRYVPAPDGFDEGRPEGSVNLGFAHGVPAIVAMLAAAHRAGIPGAREVLDPAARWLTAQRLPPGSGSAFPGHVIPGHAPQATRLAWCYGDPGIAVALLAAGDALGDGELVEQARALALGCAEQSPDTVVDATLCHGSAGLGHVFHRLGRALGDERVLDLARHWFSVTLERDLPLLTVVEVERAQRLAEDGAVLAVDPGRGFLFGAAGVGLALLAAASDGEPWWDGAMLVRPPGRGPQTAENTPCSDTARTRSRSVTSPSRPRCSSTTGTAVARSSRMISATRRNGVPGSTQCTRRGITSATRRRRVTSGLAIAAAIARSSITATQRPPATTGRWWMSPRLSSSHAPYTDSSGLTVTSRLVITSLTTSSPDRAVARGAVDVVVMLCTVGRAACLPERPKGSARRGPWSRPS